MTGDEENREAESQDLGQEVRIEEWKAYREEKRRQLKNTDFSIISLNCCGTIIYYDMGLQYLSPTINLTMGMGDFVKLVESFPWYIEQELVEINEERPYPVGLLADIKIYFIHYKTFEEALTKWNERKKRINWNNLFFLGMEKQGCTYELMERFALLPYKNKIIFTCKEYPEFSCSYYIKGVQVEGGMKDITGFKPQSLIRRYLDDFDYISFFNGTYSAKKEKSEFIKDRVSIVTPVYNGELYLASMLDSVLEQTYPYIEMILVDDGSTDKTAEIAESYRKKFIKKGYIYRVIRTFHKNASGAINQGLPFVNGEYLIWPDSDDRLEPESVEKRVNFLKMNTRYHCVRTLAYYYDNEKGILDRADEKTGDLSKKNLFWDILESKTYVCCGCYMLKSKYFFDIYSARQIPEYPVGQNFQMLLPFMYRHKCPTIQERLYGVCVREGSHSRTVLTQEEEEQKYLDYENLVDDIVNICKIDDKVSQRRIRLWKLKRRYNIARKYGKRKEMIKALYQLSLCGISGWKVVWECIKLLPKRNWIAKVKNWLYWRIRIKYAQLRTLYRRLGENVKGWFIKKGTWIYWRVRILRARMLEKWKKCKRNKKG